MMNIFKVNNEIKSYTYPVMKTFICITIIAMLINRGKIFSFSSGMGDLILTALSFVLVSACLLCMCISLVEISNLYERRVEAKRDVEKLRTKKYAVDDIVAMAEQEDILEIEIKFDGKIVKVGSSSDSCPGRSDFFDKAYFSNDGKLEEMESIEEFRERLEVYSTEGVLEVFSIDGLPVVDKKKKRINK